MNKYNPQSYTTLKKIHKHTTVNVLKTILNLIKHEKTKRRNVDINIIDELIKNFIIKDDIIVNLKIKKNKGDLKIK